jgi:DNA invertase Pin-like site-specific DNA recombinase
MMLELAARRAAMIDLGWTKCSRTPNGAGLTWSWLGRSLIDLLGTIQQLESCSVDLYLDQQAIDTTTPTGRLMFQITGAFAEFERSMIRQRIRAGLKRAVEAGKQLGRPKVAPALEKRIQSQLRAGKGMLATAKALGVGTSTVQRIAREMAAARPFDEASTAAA